MSAEFGAIERLLKSGKHVAQYGKVWAAIHEQTGLGTVMGRQLRFNRSEIDGLRRYARQLGGIDPQFGSLKGGRLAMAGKVANETLSSVISWCWQPLVMLRWLLTGMRPGLPLGRY